MKERRGPWLRLMLRTAGVHPNATPPAFPLFATAHAAACLQDPERWLAQVRAAGLVLPISRGLHLVVPERAPARWRPDPVEVAWLFAVSHVGWVTPYLSGMTAAAEHGVVRRQRGEVHITVPRQLRARRLTGIGTTVVFHQRCENHLGSPLWRFSAPDRGATGPMLASRPGELCDPTLSSRIQTALDLFHSPLRSGSPDEAEDVARRLIREVPVRDVHAVARGQRRHSAAERIDYLRVPLSARSRG